MARITYGGIVTGLKGSIAGFTFQKNSSGEIVRSRPRGRKKKTAYQTTEQVKLISFLQSYSNLSLAHKTLWSSFAALWSKTNAFGQIKKLSAQNWYISINQNLQRISKPLLLTPPGHTLPTSPGAFFLIASFSDLLIRFLPIFNPTNVSILIWASPPISTISQSLQKKIRLISIKNTPPYSVIDIKTDWESYFNIKYPPSGNTDNFSIAVMITSIEQRTGLSSPGLIQINQFKNINYGIGFLQIGTNFIIS